MAIETKRYVRNPLYVDVVEVTAENFAEVAIWCQGDFANKNGMPIERDEGGVIVRPDEMYIRVRVHSPKSIRQTQAFVGDFILYTDRGYKVYTPGAFHASWTKVQEARCDKCGAHKGRHAIGEDCNQNCGGKVIVA